MTIFTDGFYFTSSIDVVSEFTFVNSASFGDKWNIKMNSLNHSLNILQKNSLDLLPISWIVQASCLRIIIILHWFVLNLFVSCSWMNNTVSQKFPISLSLLPFPKYLYLPPKSGGSYWQEVSHCCPVIWASSLWYKERSQWHMGDNHLISFSL